LLPGDPGDKSWDVVAPWRSWGQVVGRPCTLEILGTSRGTSLLPGDPGDKSWDVVAPWRSWGQVVGRRCSLEILGTSRGTSLLPTSRGLSAGSRGYSLAMGIDILACSIASLENLHKKMAQKMTNTIKALLQMSLSSDTTRLDVELLLAYCLNVSRAYLLTYPEQTLTDAQYHQFMDLIQRRKSGEPIAYIVGHKEFWGLDLLSTPAALVPRPETELLVERALACAPNTADKIEVIDLGTGTGAIALALATERPHWNIMATDFSLPALNLAQENAQRLAITNIHFYHGDWFAALVNHPRVDMIVTNPPYIAQDDAHLLHPTLQYEPQQALGSGTTGLDAITHIIANAPHYLKPHGILLIEHGYDQSERISNLLIQAGFKVDVFADYQGIDRVAQGKLY